MASVYYRNLRENFKNHPGFKSLIKVLHGPIPSEGLVQAEIAGLDTAVVPVLSRYLLDSGIGKQIYIVPGDREADMLQHSLEELEVNSHILPSYGTAPYSPAPSRSSISGRRMSAYSRVMTDKNYVLIVPIRALLQRLGSPKEIVAQSKLLRPGNTSEPDALAKLLSSWDYQRVPRVSSPGEFAVRGEVLDVWLPGDEYPSRIAFHFEHIEAIRQFSPEDQSSLGKLDSLSLHPFSEIIWTQEMKTALRNRIEREPGNTALLAEIAVFLDSDMQHFEGEEFYLPWASSSDPGSSLELIPKEVPVFLVDFERLLTAEEALHKEADTLYRRKRQDAPVPKPSEIYLQFLAILASRKRLVPIRHLAGVPSKLHPDAEMLQHQFSSSGPRSFFGNITFLREELASLVQLGFKVFILCESEVQASRMLSILADSTGIQVEVGRLRSGFSLNDSKIVVIHESEVWGRKQRPVQSLGKTRSATIDSFVELEERDYVVHAKHGIGMYQGIQRILAGGTERDYIRVEFANEEIIFVPIEQVNLIQKYIGGQGGTPRLDRIGGKSWDTRKERVRQRVQELAEHLVRLYSRRKRARGIAFPPDTEWQYEFESRFPFEETEDQLSCIAEVKADMESTRPMDRLICGDVGFGKTEIAMRAAFKAVTAGKQVAFLAPTTILSEQHYESFLERLKGFPVRIAMLSRFVAPAQQKKILPDVTSGEVDILVGTHRIIQKDVRYKDLGLIIVDEEQRFGVKDKERLKELRVSVDSLALSATPIPRTLHMSLLKIRDMSLLKTAPLNRRPIETHVEAFAEETVAKAIRAEIARGGQVFYLHNRVEDLDRVRIFLERLVPEAVMETAHGKMSATELENIMHRFIHGGSQVLIATTIIENGINIPNVNTIIIDRADMYGVSQLYQLRGRVGRSDRLAYAYLLYPGETSLSETAMKRLQVISDNTALGSGFKIALKDLEVRGAGNLLGAEQSGEIFSVGIDMYLKLLDEEIRKLMRAEAVELAKRGELDEPTAPGIEDEEDVYLELDYSGFIPNEYISDSMEKMEIYKKIASVGDESEFELLKFEILDRFGEYPDSLHSLLVIAELRVLCKRLKIAALRERRGSIEVEFGRVAGIKVERLLEMIQSSRGSVKLDAKRPNVIRLESAHIGLKEKSEFLKARLSQLIK